MIRATSVILLLACAGCAERPLPAETLLEVEITPQQRAYLSPNVRQLLEDIEAGRAAGARASNYTHCFAEAFDTWEWKGVKMYHFLVSQEVTEREGQPEVFVKVYRGQIVSCGTYVPCW